jgi:hypothetical protein
MNRLLSLAAVTAAVALTTVAPARSMPILGLPQASVVAAEHWATENGATPRFRALARLYWRLAPPLRVRPDVAYAQAAKETAFGRFGGVLNPTFRNPCGLKRPAGGGNFNPQAHKRFPTWRVGVIAHLDHLALYAAAPGFPRAQSPDPRQFSFLLGRAHTVEALGAAWAPAAGYGRDVAQLVRDLDRHSALHRQASLRTSASRSEGSIHQAVDLFHRFIVAWLTVF